MVANGGAQKDSGYSSAPTNQIPFKKQILTNHLVIIPTNLPTKHKSPRNCDDESGGHRRCRHPDGLPQLDPRRELSERFEHSSESVKSKPSIVITGRSAVDSGLTHPYSWNKYCTENGERGACRSPRCRLLGFWMSSKSIRKTSAAARYTLKGTSVSSSRKPSNDTLLPFRGNLKRDTATTRKKPQILANLNRDKLSEIVTDQNVKTLVNRRVVTVSRIESCP